MSESKRIGRLQERLAARDRVIASLEQEIDRKDREIERLRRGRDADIAKHLVLLDQICEMKKERGQA